MASNTVKCANCNIVINEVLAFLNNVLDFMDEESIHQLCTSSFSNEDVMKAKNLLFESIPTGKRMPLRRKAGKKRMSKDLDDMIALMKSADPAIFPIFVAKELHRLPPVTFDHVDVTRLLRDILCLKNQLCALEEKVVKTDEFEILKQEVETLKHVSLIDNNFSSKSKVNVRRGACLQNSFVLNSGPIGLQYEPEYRSPLQSAVNKVNDLPSLTEHSSDKESPQDECVSLECMSPDETKHDEALAITAVPERAKENGRLTTVGCDESAGASEMKLWAGHIEASSTVTAVSTKPACSATGACDAITVSPTNIPRLTGENKMSSVKASRSPLRPRVICVANSNANCEPVVRDNNSEWQVVRRKSPKRYKLIGQKGCAVSEPDSKFRAADVKVPLLISNVCKETSVDDIVTYIKEKTNEIVYLKMINMTKVRKYNAYKLYVSESKLHLFLDDNFWPNGITFRRFVHFMYKKSDKLANK